MMNFDKYCEQVLTEKATPVKKPSIKHRMPKGINLSTRVHKQKHKDATVQRRISKKDLREYHEQYLMEKAPPGYEDMVLSIKKSLRKQGKGEEDAKRIAFATAWKRYNKKHGRGKISEAVEDFPYLEHDDYSGYISFIRKHVEPYLYSDMERARRNLRRIWGRLTGERNEYAYSLDRISDNDIRQFIKRQTDPVFM